MYSDDFEETPQLVAVLHQAMIARLADLQTTGLLDQTLVVLGIKFS